MISKGFLKSSIVYTLGGALPMLGGIILLPFYTNYLNAQQFLQVSFYILITALFQVLFTFSLDSYFGVKYTQLSGDEVKQKQFVGSTAMIILALGAFWLLVAAVSGHHVSKLVFKDEYNIEFWPYGFYSVLTGFFNAYFKTSTNALIYFKRPRIFLAFNVLNFVATLAISIGGLFLFPDSIIGPMYGRLLSGVLIFFLAHMTFSRYGTFSFEKGFLPEIKKFCIPYLFFNLSAWTLLYGDRFILQSFMDEVDLNTYDLVLKCFFGIEFLQNSLSAVIFPKLYEIWNKNGEMATTKESNRYFNVFTAVNVIQLIIFCIVLPLLYKLVITQKSFYEASAFIGMISARYGLQTIVNFYLATILFTKNIQILLKIFLITAVFQVVATYFGYIWFKLDGVLYAAIAAKVMQVILSMIFTRGIFKFEYNYFKIVLIPFIFVLVNALQFHFFPGYDVRFYLAQLAIFSVIFYFIFRNEIKQVLIQFKIVSA